MTTEARIAANSFVKLYAKSEAAAGSTTHLAEEDRETILQNIDFVEQLFPQSCIMVCPRSHPAFTYISKNSDAVLGHRQHTLASMQIPEVFGKIHPDDVSHVKQCFDFISETSTDDPADNRFVVHFRFQDATGQYQHIRNEHIALKTRSHYYLFLMLFSNVSNNEKFHQVKLDVFKNIKGNFVKVSDYNPRQGGSDMTPRQHTIATLISKGFSNKQIADQLSVSIFTVKNHKRLLFKKVNVKNSIELLSSRQLSL